MIPRRDFLRYAAISPILLYTKSSYAEPDYLEDLVSDLKGFSGTLLEAAKKVLEKSKKHPEIFTELPKEINSNKEAKKFLSELNSLYFLPRTSSYLHMDSHENKAYVMFGPVEINPIRSFKAYGEKGQDVYYLIYKSLLVDTDTLRLASGTKEIIAHTNFYDNQDQIKHEDKQKPIITIFHPNRGAGIEVTTLKDTYLSMLKTKRSGKTALESDSALESLAKFRLESAQCKTPDIFQLELLMLKTIRRVLVRENVPLEKFIDYYVGKITALGEDEKGPIKAHEFGHYLIPDNNYDFILNEALADELMFSLDNSDITKLHFTANRLLPYAAYLKFDELKKDPGNITYTKIVEALLSRLPGNSNLEKLEKLLV